MAGINTYNEKALHLALKQWYAQAGDELEAPRAGSIIDIVRGDLLIEIQTGNFTAIRRKLTRLARAHPVRLVYPIPQEKWIIKLDADGRADIGDFRRDLRLGRRGERHRALAEIVC